MVFERERQRVPNCPAGSSHRSGGPSVGAISAQALARPLYAANYLFIGEIGRQLVPGQNLNLWNEVAEQNISISDIRLWDAFEENLELALPAVRELMDSVDGKTVISSDHGQLMGERLSPIPIRHYGHPLVVHMEELIKVPWLVNGGPRREITAEPPVSETSTTVDSDTATERLKSIGYV